MTVDDRGFITACPSCGQKNRTPFNAAGKCAKCGSALPEPAEPIDVPTAEAFSALVAAARVPIIVDFWAAWCGPCRMVAPELVKLAAANAGRWLVVKVDTEALPDVARRFRVQSIPTMAVLWGGREVGRTMGARPADQIEAFVTQTLLTG